MTKPKVLVLCGYGINCDYETQFAFSSNGADADRVHVNDLISKKNTFQQYQILAIPGGFAFGDDLGSGKVLAVKLSSHLQENLLRFLERGNLIIGICNGFQVLVKLGMLPGSGLSLKQTTTLTANESGKFEDRWVYLKSNVNSQNIFTSGIERLYLPVRHGEGRFITQDEKTLQLLRSNNQIALQYVDEDNNEGSYPYNPNGSVDNIAGICDTTGRVFGLMPHPEAFLSEMNHPRWTRKPKTIVTAKKIFSNAVEYVKNNM